MTGLRPLIYISLVSYWCNTVWKSCWKINGNKQVMSHLWPHTRNYIINFRFVSFWSNGANKNREEQEMRNFFKVFQISFSYIWKRTFRYCFFFNKPPPLIFYVSKRQTPIVIPIITEYPEGVTKLISSILISKTLIALTGSRYSFCAYHEESSLWSRHSKLRWFLKDQITLQMRRRTILKQWIQ